MCLVLLAGSTSAAADDILYIADNFDITCAGQQCPITVDVATFGMASWTVEFQRPLPGGYWSTVAQMVLRQRQTLSEKKR